MRVRCRARCVERHGSTLLLALLVLGSLLATSVAVGTIVTSALRGGKRADNVALASYASESAVEEFLFDVRRRDRVPSSASGALPNGATWERTVETTVPELTLTLTRDRVEQLDLFDAAGTLAETNIRFLEIVPIGTPDPAAWLEVTWVPWIGERQEWAPAVARPAIGPSELRPEGVTVDLGALPAGVDGGRPSAYRVRFRALHADVGTVRVRAMDGSRAAVALPARIRAVVHGTVGGAQYATVVELPPRQPLAPVFDYVLFSECDIVKGGESPRCP